MQNLAERLAKYTTALTYEDLPLESIHEAKRRIIDSIGCAYGAWHSDAAEIVRRIGRQVECTSGATILGTFHKASPDWAAFVNGLMIRYLDFNDTYLSKEPAHPSDNIAAVLAVADAEGSTGKQIILATVLAYEIQCRLCDAASLRLRGWDHVNYGLFSAAAAASQLMGLSPEATRHAMSIAGVSGLAMRQTRVGKLSMWKGCAFANSSRHATFAAWLAKEGLTGPSDIFEGKMGFMKQVAGDFELGALGGENGEGFMINRTYIKYFPVEYHAQSAVWAALELRDAIARDSTIVDVDLNVIDSIDIDTFEASYSIIGSEPEKWKPQNRETADHSLPYIVGVTLADGAVNLDSFEEARYTEPKVLELVSRIRVNHDPSLDPRYPEGIPNRITLHLKDGRDLTAENTFPRGHAKNPMTDEEVEQKFHRLTENLFEADKQQHILNLLWNLDELPHLQDVMLALEIPQA